MAWGSEKNRQAANDSDEIGPQPKRPRGVVREQFSFLTMFRSGGEAVGKISTAVGQFTTMLKMIWFLIVNRKIVADNASATIEYRPVNIDRTQRAQRISLVCLLLTLLVVGWFGFTIWNGIDPLSFISLSLLLVVSGTQTLVSLWKFHLERTGTLNLSFFRWVNDSAIALEVRTLLSPTD